MASPDTKKWVKFFTRAGIPSRAAATYALTFSDNRIQMDMLLDLNKEYLRDMGITLMGDVIAILRHARHVHEELAREKLFISSNTKGSGPKPASKPPQTQNKRASPPPNPAPKTKTTKPLSPPPASSTSETSSPLVSKKATASSRMLDHYMRDTPAQRAPVQPSSVLSGSEKSALNRLGTQPETLKRKTVSTVHADLGVIDLERLEEEGSSVPMKKARRVLPEHEGGYKIKMPSGTTPRSQQILAKQKEMTSKKTVFDRLGSGSSSPTVDPPSAAVSSTTSDTFFTITGLDSKVVKKKASSVFSRLGDKQVSSSTSNVPTRENPLPYAGILKSPPKAGMKTVVVQSNAPTMVADAVASLGSEVKGRLGVSVPSSTAVKRPPTTQIIKNSSSSAITQGIFASSIETSSKMGVKARLGSSGNVSKGIEAIKRIPGKTVQSSVITKKMRSQESEPPRKKTYEPVQSNLSKRVTFSTAAGSVTKSGIFSRLGK